MKKKKESADNFFILFDVWKIKGLSIIDRIIYTKIFATYKSRHYCYVSNKQLMKFLLVTEPTIIKSISRLKEIGIIQVNYSSKKRKCKPLPEIVCTLPKIIIDSDCFFEKKLILYQRDQDIYNLDHSNMSLHN